MSDATSPDTPEPSFVPRSRKAFALCLLATVLLTAADLGTKAWALDALSTDPPGEPPPVCEADEYGRIAYQRGRGTPIVLIEGRLELRYAENCGAAFGILREAPGLVRHLFFGAAAIAASLALLWMFATGRGGPYFAWSVPFIVSGALGNLADRLRLGYVVDFIRYHWNDPLPGLGTEWPTFNVADATITVGVVLLLLDGWREGKAEKAAKAAAEGEEPAPAS